MFLFQWAEADNVVKVVLWKRDPPKKIRKNSKKDFLNTFPWILKIVWKLSKLIVLILVPGSGFYESYILVGFSQIFDPN